MGPGIVALLLTILSLFLTSVSVVREKEQQTMDTLLISRLTPSRFTSVKHCHWDNRGGEYVHGYCGGGDMVPNPHPGKPFIFIIIGSGIPLGCSFLCVDDFYYCGNPTAGPFLFLVLDGNVYSFIRVVYPHGKCAGGVEVPGQNQSPGVPH